MPWRPLRVTRLPVTWFALDALSVIPSRRLSKTRFSRMRFASVA